MGTSDQKPLEIIATFFNSNFSKEEGPGASVFSRAAAQLESAAKSALNVAQRSASWLTRKVLRATIQWGVRINDHDTVSLSHIALFKLLGGLSSSVTMDVVVGKVGFSHGGLDVWYFVADPEQTLSGNLRATFVRIAAAKTKGEFDVQFPFVFSCTWGGGNSQILCKRISVNVVGKKEASFIGEEDVSQLLEKLKISPGGGHLSDGSATIYVGQSDV